MSDVTNALHIPREDLIRRLRDVKGEHERKRAEAEEKVAKSRQNLLDLVGKLDDDQVANIFGHYVHGSDCELEKWVESVVEGEKFKTLPVEATGIETSLDRTIRVLSLANDQEIEVTPTDSIYSYL